MRRYFVRVANISSSIEKISIDPTNVIAILIKQSPIFPISRFSKSLTRMKRGGEGKKKETAE